MVRVPRAPLRAVAGACSYSAVPCLLPAYCLGFQGGRVRRGVTVSEAVAPRGPQLARAARPPARPSVRAPTCSVPADELKSRSRTCCRAPWRCRESDCKCRAALGTRTEIAQEAGDAVSITSLALNGQRRTSRLRYVECQRGSEQLHFANTQQGGRAQESSRARQDPGRVALRARPLGARRPTLAVARGGASQSPRRSGAAAACNFRHGTGNVASTRSIAYNHPTTHELAIERGGS